MIFAVRARPQQQTRRPPLPLSIDGTDRLPLNLYLCLCCFPADLPDGVRVVKAATPRPGQWLLGRLCQYFDDAATWCPAKTPITHCIF